MEKLKKINSERYIVVDFSKPETVSATFEELDWKFDSFINSAGDIIGKSLYESEFNEIDRNIRINLITPMMIMKSLEGRINHGGVVVFVGSQSGFKGSWDDCYAASKGAVHTLVKTLSLKLAPKQRVVGIAPGIVDTPMTRRAFVGDKFKEKMETIPMKRFASSEEIASLICYCLGDSAKFMTGCMLDINGGLSLR